MKRVKIKVYNKQAATLYPREWNLRLRLHNSLRKLPSSSKVRFVGPKHEGDKHTERPSSSRNSSCPNHLPFQLRSMVERDLTCLVVWGFMN